MHSAFKKYGPLITLTFAVALLWFIRIDNLNDPYFWDELGVYGSGVQYMVAHGISLQPKNLPPEISRGHPLLFYAMHASVLKIFGNSLVVSHTFALIISSLLLLIVYLLAKEILPKMLAALAALYLASQNIFLAQSSLIIPEISIALLASLGILLYFKKRYFLSALCLSVGVLIKESALLIPAFIAFFMLVDALFVKNKKQHVFSAFYYTMPLALLLFFLQIQYVQNGWYFFPYHTDIVKADALASFTNKLNEHYHFILSSQNRSLLSYAIIPALLFALISRNKKILFFAYFVLANIVMFSFAFFMDRYLLYLYPFTIIIAVYGVYKALHSVKFAQYLFLIIASISCLSSVSNRAFKYDASLAYKDLLYVHQEALHWLCKQEEAVELGGEYFITKSIEQTNFGYVNNACKQQLTNYSAGKKYTLFFHKQSNTGQLVKQINKHDARIFIYR